MRKILSALVVLIAVIIFPKCMAMAERNKITLPESLQIIEEEAFYGSTSLEKVILPYGIKEIGAKAFASSTLKEINLPESV